MITFDDFLAFDTETTGLSSSAEVIELGVAYYHRGVKVRSWNSFFCPVVSKKEDPNVQEALKVNGIEWEWLLYNAYTFRKKVEEIEREMSEVIWVAHNADFDMRMLRQEFQRLDRKPSFEPQFVFCTRFLDVYLSPNQPGYKLQDVCARWGVTQQGAHRAVVDAEACGQVFVNMLGSGRLPYDVGQAHSFVKTGEQQWKNRPRPRPQR